MSKRIKKKTTAIPDDDVTMLAKDILQLRIDYGWTQHVFAMYLRVTPRSVGYWERNDTSVKPSEYHVAILLLLRLALSESRKSGRESQYRKQLRAVLPEIMFNGGIYRLLIFLNQQLCPLKHLM